MRAVSTQLDAGRNTARNWPLALTFALTLIALVLA